MYIYIYIYIYTHIYYVYVYTCMCTQHTHLMYITNEAHLPAHMPDSKYVIRVNNHS